MSFRDHLGSWAGGVVPSPTRAAGALPSLPARFIRRAGDRARLQTTMPLAIGEHVLVECTYRDGTLMFDATVELVHRDGFVDFQGWTPLDDDEVPVSVRVRK